MLGNTLLFHSVVNVQVAGEFKVGDFFFFLIGFQQLCSELAPSADLHGMS